MFTESTKAALYLIFVVPIIAFLAIEVGTTLQRYGLVSVLIFQFSLSALILGLLIYSKIPSFKAGQFFNVGADYIDADRRLAYKASFQLLVILFFVSIAIIS